MLYHTKEIEGSFGFATPQTADLNNLGRTGSDIAAFVLGVVDRWAYRDRVYDLEAQVWDLYVQDSWRVTDKLTLNYGMRWDLLRNAAFSELPVNVGLQHGKVSGRERNAAAMQRHSGSALPERPKRSVRETVCGIHGVFEIQIRRLQDVRSALWLRLAVPAYDGCPRLLQCILRRDVRDNPAGAKPDWKLAQHGIAARHGK
jgi:TonB dependent receptor